MAIYQQDIRLDGKNVTQLHKTLQVLVGENLTRICHLIKRSTSGKGQSRQCVATYKVFDMAEGYCGHYRYQLPPLKYPKDQRTILFSHGPVSHQQRHLELNRSLALYADGLESA